MTNVISRYLQDEGVAVFEKKGDGRTYLCKANELNCRLLGIPYPESLGRDIRRLFDPAFAERVCRTIRRALEGKRALKFLQRHEDQEESRWWLVVAEAIPDRSRRLVRFSSSMVDVSAGMEDPICSSRPVEEIPYQAFLEGASDAIMGIQLQDEGGWRLLYANSLFLSWVKHPLADLQKINLEELMPPDMRRFSRELLRECLELRHSVEGTYHWQADGNERFYHVTLRPLYTRDTSELLVFIQNVTETILDRRKKDELLYEYECYFQSTVNGVGLIRLEEDLSSSILRANPPFHTFLTFLRRYRGEGRNELILRQIQREKKRLQLQIKLPVNDECALYYDLCIMPILYEDRVEKLFITCVNTTQSMQLAGIRAARLTKREEEVLGYIIAGQPNKVIALQLHVSEGTVKRFVSNMYKKLHVQSRSELIRYCLGDQYTAMATETLPRGQYVDSVNN